MTRKDLQELAALRLKEAGLLLAGGCPSGAYYLAGYAAECAIKACIAKQTEKHDFPDKKKANDSWVHDLSLLIQVAGLKDTLRETMIQHPEFNARWQVVQEWNEKSRYQNSTQAAAEKLLDALKHPRHGVIQWLELHW
ncbi:MAG: DNA-binding protein [Bryobacteraceae bacterium]